MTQIISADLVALDADLGSPKDDVICQLVDPASPTAGRATDVGRLYAPTHWRARPVGDRAARRHRDPALPLGARHRGDVARRSRGSSRGVDFGAPDGPADLVFLIAAPAGGESDHLNAAHRARAGAGARRVHRRRCGLRAPRTRSSRWSTRPSVGVRRPHRPRRPVVRVVSIVGVLRQHRRRRRRVPPPPPSTPPWTRSDKPLIVAVTACPTGIAHTYMAADSLVAAGERAGVDVVVETQGSSGRTAAGRRERSPRAEAVIFATDVGVREQGALRRQAGRRAPASSARSTSRTR